MALIINAEIPAGPTIEEAIRSCVEFAERNHCSVRTEINDIPMLISYGSNFTEHPGMPYSIQDCTDFFVNAYKKYVEQKNNEFKKVWIRRFSKGEEVWYEVLDIHGNCLYKSSYEDECVMFCDENELDLQMD